MAALFLLQCLLVGTLLVPAYSQTQGCNSLQNAVEGAFSVTVTPEAYVANTTYLVTISNVTTTNVTNYFLQALDPQSNSSVGEWKGVDTQNCGANATAMLNGTVTATLNATQNAANWTSPDSTLSSVELRAYVVFVSSPTEFKTVTLQKAPETKPTTASPTTTKNAVSAVQSSSFFTAAVQLLMLLATCKLFS